MISSDTKRKFATHAICVGAVEIIQKDDTYQVDFRYNLHGGFPQKQKYDTAISRYVPLCETAMVLKAGEYGRVLYNGRYLTFEDCYYKMGIVNIINQNAKNSPDVFVCREPDHVYEQLAHLF